MAEAVTLGGRGKLATLLNKILHCARHQPSWQQKPDLRHLRTFKHLLLGVLVDRSAWLMDLGETLLGWRREHSVRAAAMGLSYFLPG